MNSLQSLMLLLLIVAATITPFVLPLVIAHWIIGCSWPISVLVAVVCCLVIIVASLYTGKDG